MKKCLKGKISPLLKQYQIDNPTATWEQFKNECPQGYKRIQKRLRQNQGNLCCYCEIDLKQGDGTGKDDFRVEHFHPKSGKKNSRNWALDWQNMLGCCHGGTEQYVTESQHRFTENKKERHSDALKGNFDWDNEILNPLEIPVFPILFKANRVDGSLSVLEDNCRNADIDVKKANNCLDSKKLNLNSAVLNRHRKKTLDALNQQIEVQMSNGLTIEQAMLNLAKAVLEKNTQGDCSAFFTTIRSYLGKVAENHLKIIGYQG
jgi:uncharacterized protein (TIGR02646 family)